MSVKRDYYEILGVSPSASAAEVKAAYRSLAKKLHPDRGGSAEALAAVNEAADVLTDPKRREAYDRDRNRSGAQATASHTAQSGPTKPRKKVTVALCDMCGTLNRVKDDPDYVAASCGKCGRPLGKAGAGSSTQASPASTTPEKPAETAADSYGQILTDALHQFMGGGLKQTMDLPGMDKIREGVKELTEHLTNQARSKGASAEQAKSKLEAFETYLKKLQRND